MRRAGSLYCALWSAGLTFGLAVVGQAQTGSCIIDTFAGGATVARGDGGPAVDAELFLANDARVSPDGLVYIADWEHHRIRRITANGLIETIAGDGVGESSGDGGPAVQARLREPKSLAFSSDGSLFVLEALRVRRIDPDGIITTIAGGPAAYSPDVGLALDAGIASASRIAVGPDGSVYIAFRNRSVVYRVLPNGAIDRFAGSGARTGPLRLEGIPAVEARLGNISDIAIDLAGDVYILEGSILIRRVASDGTIETHVGGQVSLEDGTPQEDVIVSASRGGVEIDSEGRVYWFDVKGVRRIGADGLLETVWPWDFSMGSPVQFSLQGDTVLLALPFQLFRASDESGLVRIAGAGPEASRGDGGPATEATLAWPSSLAAGNQGELYFNDEVFGRIRVVKDGVVSRFAGNPGLPAPVAGAAATDVSFGPIGGIAVGPGGVVYIGAGDRVWRVGPDGLLELFAGGPATSDPLRSVEQLAADSLGNVYILHRDPRSPGGRWIRRVSADGTADTITDKLPGGAFVSDVHAIAVDSQDNLVFSDESAPPRGRYWRVSPEGEISRITATDGYLENPRLVAADGLGNIYHIVAGTVVRISSEGNLSSMIRPDVPRDITLGDGGPPEEAYVGHISGAVADREGNLYLANEGTGRIRRINVSNCADFARPQILAATNGASFRFGLAPGTVLSVFGTELGPQEGVGARVEGGRLACRRQSADRRRRFADALRLFGTGKRDRPLRDHRERGAFRHRLILCGPPRDFRG